MQALGDSADWLAKRLFIPSSLAVLVLGILLTIEGPWSFDILWVDLGFVGFAASFLTGLLFLKPEGERIGRAIAAHGPGSSEARQHIRRITVVSACELVILVLVVAAMSIKPTSDDGGTVLLFALVTAAAVAAGAWSLRTPSPEPAAADVVRLQLDEESAAGDAVTLLDVHGLHGRVVRRRRAASPSSSPRARAAAAALRHGRPARR